MLEVYAVHPLTIVWQGENNIVFLHLILLSVIVNIFPSNTSFLAVNENYS